MNDHAGGGRISAAGIPPRGQARRRPPLPTRVDLLPPLPSGYDDALDAGLAALGLALAAAAREAIASQVRLLLAWNAAINLTTITEPERVAVLHVLDSLAAMAHLPPGPLQLADVGSGGGYPGLPLAAARRDIRVTLVDSVAKKARFLEAAAAATGLAERVAVVADRAESLALAIHAGGAPAFDVVTARAVASLPELAEMAFPLLRVGGRLIAWKGDAIQAELQAATRAVAALGGGSVTVHNVHVPGLEGHRLVVVEKAGPTPAGYPRDPGRRRRAHW